MGPHAHFVEGSPDFVIVSLLQLDHRLRGQGLHREGVAVGQGMPAGHDDLQLVQVQGVHLQSLQGRHPQKSAVRLPGDDQLLDLVVEVAGLNFELDGRIQLAESLQNHRQPLGGDAGKRGHLHKACVHAPQVCRLLGQSVIFRAELLNLRKQCPAVAGQGHAAPVPAQQGHPQLLLQGADGVADSGLGEVQLLRRLGKAAAFHSFQENLVFCGVHCPHLPLF